MTTYMTAGRAPEIAHRPSHEIGRQTVWLCGQYSAHARPVRHGERLRFCQRCDGKAFGHVVYRCFDSAGDLLYVGSTNDIATRLTAHSAKPWWTEVGRITVEGFDNVEDVRAAEYQAIRDECPRENKRGRLVPA